MLDKLNPVAKEIADRAIKDKKQMPLFSLGLRPFYLGCSIFGVVAILFWIAGYHGTAQLPNYFWHAHEMIWGFTGGIIVGFLLTAVVNWTGVLTAQGPSLAMLFILWLAARLLLYVPGHGLVLCTVASMLFFIASAYYFARPVIVTRNKRNFMPIGILAIFALTDLGFLLNMIWAQSASGLDRLHYIQNATHFMYGGLLMVVAIMSLVSMRILPFFTARRLGSVQRNMPIPLHILGLLMPTFAMISVILGYYLPAAILCVLVCCNILFLIFRSYAKGVLGEPMLWVLYFALICVAIGAPMMTVSLAVGSWHNPYFLAPNSWINAGVHLITVGGIGCLTLGMMARTAMAHTGRKMRAVFPMPLAYGIMAASCIVRVIAAFLPGVWYTAGIHLSGALFILALALFLGRYAGWLVSKSAS